MDFKVVLDLIIADFEKQNVHYAVIGGFALGLLGVQRATIDLDFLVLRDDLSKVDVIMKKYGYECAHRTENVSQYTSGVKLFGEVDFLHAFREISVGMLKRAKEADIFDKKLKIKVLNPEDIIGLKLQAAVNNPNRSNKEYIDIENLFAQHRTKMDWELLEDYFYMFEQKEKFIEFKTKYGTVK